MSSMEKFWQILIQPYTSEKVAKIGVDRQYVFSVMPDATKIDVKKAVEQIFQVKVKDVQICNVKPKAKKALKTRKAGFRKGWKKAYICLQEGQAINFENFPSKEAK